MPKVYKYFSHDVFDLVFVREGFCALKFSLPKDYNDPYELFLALDLTVPTDHLATYNDIVQELPQLPTTCFSKSPIVSPMWAHYAKNHSGFVLEFDTDTISENFSSSSVRDVIYMDKPDTSLNDLLAKAAVIGKPRYASWLRDAVVSTAYFAKYRDWAYEREARMVVDLEETEDVAGNNILFLPAQCLTAIIIGSNFPEDMKPTVKVFSDLYMLNSYQIKIGKSYPVPYLIDDKEGVFIFADSSIVKADLICASCSEPLVEDGENCPWCRITDDHKYNAAIRNPYRILDHYGALEGYLKAVESIKRRRR